MLFFRESETFQAAREPSLPRCHQEMADIVVHLSKDGQPLFLNAGKNIPLMVQALAKKEVAA